jgi:SAM-dependent methyltransferase
LPEFTGERVIPGEVEPDLFNEHFARYAFAERLGRGQRVLDLGCGTGYGAAEMARTAVSVTGVDVSGDAVAYARAHFSRPNLSFVQGSCIQLPFEAKCFDVAIAFELIEHLAEWRLFLQEVRRVLSPSGAFVVSTPNKSYYAESRGQAGPNPFHEHEFEPEELLRELSVFFPSVRMFAENHAGSLVFAPLSPRGDSSFVEARVESGAAADAAPHFVLAVCGEPTPVGLPAYVYVPSTANLLRERERHIGKLEAQVTALARESSERTEWALSLNREIEERDRQLLEAQGRLSETEEESRRNREAAQHIAAEREEKCQELAQAVQLLDRAEKTVVERTQWAQQTQAESERLRSELTRVETSFWVKLGRKLGLVLKSSAR